MTLLESVGSGFAVVVADPPWQYQKNPGIHGAGAAANGAAEKHYPTMTTEAIAALDVASVAADDAHLFLWTTNPKMYGGRFSPITAAEIARAWGFEYRTTLTWIKTTAAGTVSGGGMGHYFRGATEHVIYATRGRARIEPSRREPNVILAPTSRHSRKPEAFMALVERVTDGPYLELFAREQRPGWTAWGNELSSNSERSDRG